MSNSENSSRPYGLQWRSNTFFIISTVAIGLFTDLFLYGLVVPILPFILRERIGIPHSQIQHYTSVLLACYAGASVIFSLPAGIIADKLPARQLPFLVGLIALLAATILLWLGQSMAALIVARLLQGMSAAAVWTIGLALVMDTVGIDKLGVTIGSIFSFISVGELLSPLLGGVVYDKAGSSAVFGMGLGLLVVDFFMRLVLIEKKTAAKYRTLDDEQDCDESQDSEEANEEDPLISKKDEHEDWRFQEELPKWVKTFPTVYCLKNPRLLTAQLVAFTHATLVGVYDATIPTEAQDLFAVDPLKAGLMFAPLVVPYLLLGPIAGKLVDKYGVKYSAVIGFLYMGLPLLLLRIPHQGGKAEMIKYAGILFMNGLGLAFVSAPSIVEASHVVEKYHKANRDFFGEQGPYAQLYAINSIFFCLGLTVGPLAAGWLRTKLGYGNMNVVVAGLCLVVSFLSFVFLGGTPKILRPKRA